MGSLSNQVLQHLGRVIQYVFPAIGKLYCQPVSTDSTGGWGPPFNDPDNGTPINPPLGTPGGTPNEVALIRPSGNPTGEPRIIRGVSSPPPAESFDWMGQESEPGKLDQPMLNFAGPHSRYFHIWVPQGPNTNDPFEITTNFYDTKFWHGKKEVDGPGDPIRGGCIYDFGGPDEHYVVLVGSDIQTVGGVSLYKSPTSGEPSWTLIGTVSSVRAGNRPDGTPGDPDDYFQFWDTPWHFNAAGNKAIWTGSARIDSAPPDYVGMVEYIIGFDLNSVSILSEEEPNTKATGSTTYTWTNPNYPDGNPHSASAVGSFGNDYELIASDFAWPTDDVVRFGQSTSGFFNVSAFLTGAGDTGCTNERGSSFEFLMTGGDTIDVDASYYKLVLDSPFNVPLTATLSEGYEFGAQTPGQRIWLWHVQGADLRFRSMSLISWFTELKSPQFVPGASTINPILVSCGTCTANDDLGTRSQTAFSHPIGWCNANVYLSVLRWVNGNGAQTNYPDDGNPRCWITTVNAALAREFRSNYLFGGNDVDECQFNNINPSKLNGTFGSTATTETATFVIQGTSIKQNTSILQGDLATDRGGNVFYSVEYDWQRTSFFDGIPSIFNGLEANGIWPNTDDFVDYDYENADIDAIVGITGDLRKYYPIIST